MLKENLAQRKFKQRLRFSLLVVASIVVTVFILGGFRVVTAVAAEEAVVKEMNVQIACWAFLSAAIAASVSAVAAGIAVAYVGAAALGMIGERPELMGRSLVFVGLAEGIAIYGLIIAIMIMGKV